MVLERKIGPGLPLLAQVASAVVRHVDVENLTTSYSDYKLIFCLSPAESELFDAKLKVLRSADTTDAAVLHMLTSSFADKRYTRSELQWVVSSLLLLYRNHEDVLDFDADALSRDFGLNVKDIENNVFERSDQEQPAASRRQETDENEDVRLHASVKFTNPISVFGATKTAAPVRIRRTSNA